MAGFDPTYPPIRGPTAKTSAEKSATFAKHSARLDAWLVRSQSLGVAGLKHSRRSALAEKSPLEILSGLSLGATPSLLGSLLGNFPRQTVAQLTGTNGHYNENVEKLNGSEFYS